MARIEFAWIQRIEFSVFYRQLYGGSDLLISDRFRSCICTLILEGDSVPMVVNISVYLSTMLDVIFLLIFRHFWDLIINMSGSVITTAVTTW